MYKSKASNAQRTREVIGYTECGQRFVMLQRSRWDYIHGQGWVRSWEDLLYTAKPNGHKK